MFWPECLPEDIPCGGIPLGLLLGDPDGYFYTTCRRNCISFLGRKHPRITQVGLEICLTHCPLNPVPKQMAENGWINSFDHSLYKYLHWISTGICQDLSLPVWYHWDSGESSRKWMQICNYTSQDSDHFVAMFHQNTEIACWFDGYRDLFHFLLHISSNICMHLCVCRRFVSVPVRVTALRKSLHTHLGIKWANIYLSRNLTL